MINLRNSLAIVLLLSGAACQAMQQPSETISGALPISGGQGIFGELPPKPLSQQQESKVIKSEGRNLVEYQQFQGTALEWAKKDESGYSSGSKRAGEIGIYDSAEQSKAKFNYLRNKYEKQISESELDQLAGNVATAREWVGVHYLADEGR